MHGFDIQAVDFKQSINMFERMEISDNIYEYVVYPS